MGQQYQDVHAENVHLVPENYQVEHVHAAESWTSDSGGKYAPNCEHRD